MATPLFPDRTAAGQRLAAELVDLADHRPVVFGLPRCGLPVACEIARCLRAPLDVALIRTVRAPNDRARLVATILEGHPPEVRMEPDWKHAPGVSEDWLDHQVSAAFSEIEQRRRRYRDGGGLISPSGRAAILVDQAIGPGHAMAGAIRLIRAARPSMLVVAAPVAGRAGAERCARLADRVACLHYEAALGPLDLYYDEAAQVSHDEALACLARAADFDE